jgi:hypothetical protein
MASRINNNVFQTVGDSEKKNSVKDALSISPKSFGDVENNERCTEARGVALLGINRVNMKEFRFQIFCENDTLRVFVV